MGSDMTKDIILVVDDKEVNRFMICEIFRDKYQLLEAADWLEAIERLKEYKDKIAIVLLDIIMPNMDGFGVLEYMKNNELFEEIPVVMITSDASVETEKKLEQYDVAEMVRKPFIPAIVSRRVNNIISLYNNKRKHDEILKLKIEELNIKLEENAKNSRLDIEESVYLVKTLYNVMKDNNVLTDELEEDIKDYLARYKWLRLFTPK